MSSEQGTMPPATEQAVAEQAPVEQTPAELSLNDLMSLKLILQVSTRRGCWLAEELEDVGRLYKRLSAFLERVAPQADAGAAPEAATADAATDSAVPSEDSEKIVI
tara:strand:- start:428 stop:745 length:318 start_codon:yes stop_codon:yes gene_type:complete